MMFLGLIRLRLGNGGTTTEVLDDLREGDLLTVVVLVFGAVLLEVLSFSGGGCVAVVLLLLLIAVETVGATVVVVGATAAVKGESHEVGDENKVDRLDCRKLGGACLGTLRSGLPVLMTVVAATVA